MDTSATINSNMKKYAAYLKRLYSSKQGKNLAAFNLARIVNIQGEVDKVLPCENYPLTEDEVGKNLCDNSYLNAKLVLIQGPPGIGKTTFSFQFCYKWSQGEVLQQYSLLVLLPLRDIQVRSAKTISDLFYHPRLQEATSQEIVNSQGEGVALWLDGFDELDEDLRIKTSIFLELIYGRILPKSTVFVTSRPWASQDIVANLLKQSDQFIVITSTPNFQRDRVLGAKAIDSSLRERFIEYTLSNPAILAAMDTPNSANIVAEVFGWTHKTDSPPPTTITQLYTAFTFRLLTQHLSSEGIPKPQLKRFDELPPNVYKQFLSICKIAYNGIFKQQLVFYDLSLDFKSLGLMNAVEQLYSEDHTHKSHNFIHITLQEYLAAFHISQLSLEEQNALIQEHLKSSYFTIVLRFLRGMSQLKHLTPDLVSQLLKYSKLTLFHWLFEAADHSVVATSLQQDAILVNSSHSWIPLDFFVTGYCLSLSSARWGLDFSLFVNDNALKMFTQGVLLNSEDEYKGYIAYAEFQSNAITADGLNWFVKLPQKVVHKLVTLNLRDNKLDKSALVLLSKSIPVLTSLEELHLGVNPVGNGGAVELLNFLRTNNTTLKSLDLMDTGIGEEDITALCELVTCSRLKQLSVNTLSSDSVISILNALSKSSLEDLTMADSVFTEKSAAALSSILQHLECRVKSLGICNCNITPEFAVNMGEALINNHSLEGLDLSKNPIGSEGAVAIAKVLFENKTLESVWLIGSDIGEVGVLRILSGLQNNSTLNELWLPKKYGTKTCDTRVVWCD